MNWYVICTKPRWEKKVAERLAKMQMEVYCPLKTEVRQWSDRKKKIRIPLFTSYVFVYLNEKDRLRVFDVPGVLKYLMWLQKPAVIKEEEIAALKHWIGNDKVSSVRVSELTQGEKVTIREGVFKGLDGIIEEPGFKKVKILLPQMNCSVQIRVDMVE